MLGSIPGETVEILSYEIAGVPMIIVFRLENSQKFN